MFRFVIHKNIRLMISFFYRFGFWHRYTLETLGRKLLKLFYSIYPCLFLISIITAVFTSESVDVSMFMIEVSIIITVVLMRVLYIIWHKEDIMDHLNRICDYSVDDLETFVMIDNKLENLMKFIKYFLIAESVSGVPFAIVSSFIGAERTIFIPIAFPLDWRHDEFAFWIALLYYLTEATLAATSLSFAVITWYLMASSSWRYEALGNQMVKMGISSVEEVRHDESRKITSNVGRDGLYSQDLLTIIRMYYHLNE